MRAGRSLSVRQVVFADAAPDEFADQTIGAGQKRDIERCVVEDRFKVARLAWIEIDAAFIDDDRDRRHAFGAEPDGPEKAVFDAKKAHPGFPGAVRKLRRLARCPDRDHAISRFCARDGLGRAAAKDGHGPGRPEETTHPRSFPRGKSETGDNIGGHIARRVGIGAVAGHLKS